ncbi:MAG: asparagine--tRNA ligase [Bacteroidota bacterium]|nr:asparagine--tRNA ligase [Bacteroidota bacterium]
MKLLGKDTIYISELQNFNKKVVNIQGWVMNKRTAKGIVFLIIRDGSGFAQCIVNAEDVETELFENVKKLGLESSLFISGVVVKDEKQVGGYEIHVSDVKIYHETIDYPISKKEHGVDFLMENRHLWLRSSKQWAIMRVRNRIIFSIHNFFQERGFVQMDSPIFTGNAVEGTSTLFKTDFFDDPAYLSQSGQLYGEAMAMAMGLIYTFGPTFRAEKSKTRRHLSEFWMIEPEMAFYNNEKNMDLIEDFIRYVIQDILKNNKKELEILERDTTILENITKSFPKLTYDEAVEILKGNKNVDGKNALEILKEDLKKTKEEISDVESKIAERESILSQGGIKKGKRNFLENKNRLEKIELKKLQEDERNIPNWLKSAELFKYGSDFGGSDETVLTRLFDTPIMIYNWPKEIKAFYMKEVEGNPKLVKGVDVLAPEGYGEIVGGGERETSEKILIDGIKKHKLPMEAFEWYLDIRRFGSVPHAGFGLGLERLVSWICKIDHVRESIPFARMMGTLFP